MQEDTTILLGSGETVGGTGASIISYSVAAILSPVCLFLALAPKYCHTSRWLRSIFLLFATILPIQSTIGFLLLFYSEHFARQTSDYLFQWKSQLNGVLIGLLISLLLNPEFRRLARAVRSNGRV
jgi:hypothetical protein